MKTKFTLFAASLLLAVAAKAQDTLPFHDPCLGYPYVYLIVDEYPNGRRIIVNDWDSLSRIPLCWRATALSGGLRTHTMFTQSGGATVYGIAVMANTEEMPAWASFFISRLDDSRNISDLDSIIGPCHYHKKIFYDFHTETACDITETDDLAANLLPCYFYLFDHSVFVPDTFMMSSTCIYDDGLRDYHLYVIDAANSTLPLSPERDIRTFVFNVYSRQFSISGGYLLGLFPILNLCPSPRIPIVGPNYTGHARISWHPGDTSLYQLAFYSYDNDNLLFETDTLTETSYTVTDTTTPVPLQEGWYNVRLRKGCDYMDSPYHTVVWSEWSEPKRFYYIPRPEPGGIATPTIEPPFFTLSPNPAVHDVTLSFEEPLPEGSVLELYGPGGRRIEIFSILQGTVKQTIDTQKYPSGLYLLRLSTPTSATSRKLSIVH